MIYPFKMMIFHIEITKVRPPHHVSGVDQLGCVVNYGGLQRYSETMM